MSGGGSDGGSDADAGRAERGNRVVHRVLQVRGSASGGLKAHVRSVLAGLGDAGLEVHLAAPDASAETDFPGTDVPITARPNPARDLVAIRSLRALARSTDVIHAHGLRAGGLAALALAGLRRKPGLVVTVHNLAVGSPATTAIASSLETLIARRADVALGVSRDLVQRLSANADSRLCCERALIPAPPREPTQSRDETRAELGMGTQTVLVLCVARLAPQKGLEFLLQAASDIRSQKPWRLVLVGDGPLEAALRKRAEDKRLPVDFLGRREDVPNLLLASDIVVAPSVWEGQPILIQEALRAPTAIVSTDSGGTAEVTGSAASLVAYGDVTGLAREIGDLIQSPEMRAKLREQAAQQAETLPDQNRMIEQLRKMYEQAVTIAEDRRRE